MMREKQKRGASKALLGAMLAGMLLAATPALAQEGREFAGFYELTGVTASGDSTLLTLNLQVFNFGDFDVNYGTITLEDPLMLEEGYGTFPAVYLPSGGDIKLAGDFTIPARLYQEWQEGLPPRLSLLYQAADGNTYLRMIELAFMPIAEEESP